MKHSEQMVEPVVGVLSSEGKSLDRKWLAATLLAVLLSILLSCIAARHRLPWSDEGWFSSAAYNLAHRGTFGTTVLESKGTNLTRMDRRTYWVMPLFLLGQAAWYTIVPSTVFWTRVFSILWIPVLSAAYYVFLARLLDRRTAALAVILLVLSFVFITNASNARPDVMCCALGLCGLASYLSLRKYSIIRALLVSNAFIAASLFTHPNGVLHFLALVVLVLWLDRRKLNLLAILVAACPYILFLLGWAVYIMQDVQAFKDQMTANGTNDRWANTLNPLMIFWNELKRYLATYGLVTRGTVLLKAYALFAYITGLLGVLFTPRLRQQTGVRIILVLLGLYFVVMAVFNQKLSSYLVHILPLYIAVLSVWIVWGWNRWPRARPGIFAAVVVLLGLETGGILLKAWQRSYIDQQMAAVTFIRSRTGPSARIVGTAGLLYMMNFDDRLRDDLYLGLRSDSIPDMIVVDTMYRDSYAALEKARPEDMREIHARMSEYRLAYSSGDYDVYLRSDKAER